MYSGTSRGPRCHRKSDSGLYRTGRIGSASGIRLTSEFGDSWKSTTRRSTTIFTAGSVQQELWMHVKTTSEHATRFSTRVIKDGVYTLHNQLRHKCFQKKEMQPFPLTRMIRTVPIGVPSFEHTQIHKVPLFSSPCRKPSLRLTVTTCSRNPQLSSCVNFS